MERKGEYFSKCLSSGTLRYIFRPEGLTVFCWPQENKWAVPLQVVSCYANYKLSVITSSSPIIPRCHTEKKSTKSESRFKFSTSDSLCLCVCLSYMSVCKKRTLLRILEQYRKHHMGEGIGYFMEILAEFYKILHHSSWPDNIVISQHP